MNKVTITNDNSSEVPASRNRPIRKSPRISTLTHSTENIINDRKREPRKAASTPKKIKLTESLNAEEVLRSSYATSNKTPKYGLKRLGYSFFDVPCEDLAKKLLGTVLVRRLDDGTIVKGRIVETECYPGGDDKASVSHDGRITEKIRAVYMKPGTMYVYVTYGMYHCFNISSQGPGAAVLLRAVDPLEGVEYMQQERGKRKKNTTPEKSKELELHDLCNGPAKLCISFNITKSTSNEQDLCSWDGMWIEEDKSGQKSLNSNHIVVSQRIGIDSVGIKWASKPLRFYLLGNSSVSRRDKIKEKEFEEKIKCI
ncbi:uncharacterized protein [Periplaneta americana]|uniref:uncharacterized protein n=1 Tax=Periplaneta americana TaxID=6978 RepID=UPI0037E85E53